MDTYETYQGVPQNPYLRMISVSDQRVIRRVHKFELTVLHVYKLGKNQTKIEENISYHAGQTQKRCTDEATEGAFMPPSIYSDIPVLRRTTSDFPSDIPSSSVKKKGRLLRQHQPWIDAVDAFDYQIQSSDTAAGIDTLPTTTTDSGQEQNVGFSDLDNNVISNMPHPMDYTKVDTSQNVLLGKFLERPVQIFTKSWAIGDTLDYGSDGFDPWQLFFNKTSIKKKLDNYYMVRCNLHLKFVINASPFYYGCAIAAYQPLTTFTPGYIKISSGTSLENVSLSQRPHIYLYPQDSQGGEMVLPFLYHKNWLDATSSDELTAMGSVELSSFSVLANANGVVGESIDIIVYAWAEDIEVAGPTVALAVQSRDRKSSKNAKDEYEHEGVVSRPASAIARAAGQLEKVPIIGPFATATSYAAGAVADIASLFGYTNVPVIDDVHSFRNHPYPNLASTDIGTPVEKLTLDAKNELSIDPKITGVDINDELMISSFVSRESFLFESSWLASDATDTGLFYCKVGPGLLRAQVGTNQTYVWATPMRHVSLAFKYWRGDIIFRFKFICSQYHRGRVRINWDPHGDIGTAGDYTTETYTQIVDITQETDVEFRVPYTQTVSYLRTYTGNAEVVKKTDTSTTNIGTLFNGIITMRVLNPQTSPVSSANIKVLAFVRGADNLEFACPQQIDSTNTLYEVQSQDVKLDQGIEECNLGVQESIADPNINNVYMGECIKSLRQLFRRSNQYLRIIDPGTPSTGSLMNVFKSNISRIPLYPGFDTDGVHIATGLTDPVDKAYNFVNWSHASWFSPCFVGQRGSYIYTANPHFTNSLSSFSIMRSSEVHDSTTFVQAGSYVMPDVRFVRYFTNTSFLQNGSAGVSMVNQRSLSGNMTLLPMYSEYKFISNGTAHRTNGFAADGTDEDCMTVQWTAETSTTTDSANMCVDLYVAAGTDFNLVFFLNVPTIIVYDSLPTKS
jgi:hypothetical protein